MGNILHSDADQKALETLFSQEMSRKQFIFYIGGAIVGIIGMKSFLDSLLQRSNKTSTVVKNGAYGGGNYSTRNTTALPRRNS